MNPTDNDPAVEQSAERLLGSLLTRSQDDDLWLTAHRPAGVVFYHWDDGKWRKEPPPPGRGPGPRPDWPTVDIPYQPPFKRPEWTKAVDRLRNEVTPRILVRLLYYNLICREEPLDDPRVQRWLNEDRQAYRYMEVERYSDPLTAEWRLPGSEVA